MFDNERKHTGKKAMKQKYQNNAAAESTGAREKIIVKTSIIGIIVNLLLAVQCIGCGCLSYYDNRNQACGT